MYNIVNAFISSDPGVQSDTLNRYVLSNLRKLIYSDTKLMNSLRNANSNLFPSELKSHLITIQAEIRLFFSMEESTDACDLPF